MDWIEIKPQRMKKSYIWFELFGEASFQVTLKKQKDLAQSIIYLKNK
jgi:hypothetical protein